MTYYPLSFRQLLSAFAVLAVYSTSLLAQEVRWLHDYGQARKVAGEQQLPILIDCGSDHCIWCDRLDATTFRDANVVRALNSQFVTLKVNASKNPSLAKSLGVNRFPTLMFASPKGEILHVQTGYVDARKMLGLLQGTLAKIDHVHSQAMQVAMGYIQRGETVCAISSLKNIVKKSNNPTLQQQARKMLTQLEGQAKARLTRAQSLIKEGKTSEASALYQEVLSVYPGTEAASETVLILTNYVQQK